MNAAPLTNEQRFKLVQRYIDKMPSLSTTVTKVLEICNKPNTSPNDLNRVISLDPVLTGQVLKLINSAYYSLPNQITSLTRAIIMLGLNTVKNLALSTAILGTVGRAESFQCLSMDLFWAHSICVGVTAKALAARKGVAVLLREEYFVAGLLHDLGKIPLNKAFSKEYQQALDLAKLEQGSLYQAENMMMGVDHAMVGKMIAEKWQLNETLIDLLGCHHEPKAGLKKNQDIKAIVALANMYANLYDIGYAGDRFPNITEMMEVLDIVGMKWSDIAALQETVREEIDKAQVFLKVAQEGK